MAVDALLDLLPRWDLGGPGRANGQCQTCILSSWLVTLHWQSSTRVSLPSVPLRSMRPGPAAPTDDTIRRDETRRCTASGVSACREADKAGTEAHARGAESRERFAFCSVYLFWWRRGKKRLLEPLHLSCRFSILVYKL